VLAHQFGPVEYDNGAGPLIGFQVNLPQHLSDIADPDYGPGRLSLFAPAQAHNPKIGVVAPGDAGALNAITARFSWALHAIYALGQVQGKGHLTHMWWTYQQVCVGRSALLEAGLHMPEYVVLSVYLPHS
jgi:hypothetical protein